MEQIYYTIDAIFTNKNRLQKTRLSNRNIRGIAKVVAINTFLRRRLGNDYTPVIDPKTGNFTESEYDNKIIAAVTDAVITAKISKTENRERNCRSLVQHKLQVLRKPMKEAIC